MIWKYIHAHHTTASENAPAVTGNVTVMDGKHLMEEGTDFKHFDLIHVGVTVFVRMYVCMYVIRTYMSCIYMYIHKHICMCNRTVTGSCAVENDARAHARVCITCQHALEVMHVLNSSCVNSLLGTLAHPNGSMRRGKSAWAWAWARIVIYLQAGKRAWYVCTHPKRDVSIYDS